MIARSLLILWPFSLLSSSCLSVRRRIVRCSLARSLARALLLLPPSSLIALARSLSLSSLSLLVGSVLSYSVDRGRLRSLTVTDGQSTEADGWLGTEPNRTEAELPVCLFVRHSVRLADSARSLLSLARSNQGGPGEDSLFREHMVY